MARYIEVRYVAYILYRTSIYMSRAICKKGMEEQDEIWYDTNRNIALQSDVLNGQGIAIVVLVNQSHFKRRYTQL